MDEYFIAPAAQIMDKFGKPRTHWCTEFLLNCVLERETLEQVLVGVFTQYEAPDHPSPDSSVNPEPLPKTVNTATFTISWFVAMLVQACLLV